jgi:hypothetical protein
MNRPASAFGLAVLAIELFVFMFSLFQAMFTLADGGCGECRPNLDLSSASYLSKIAGLSQDFNNCPPDMV